MAPLTGGRDGGNSYFPQYESTNMHTDAQGNVLTTESAEAAALFSQAITDFMDYRTTPSARLKEALEKDPDFALAACFRGCFLMMLENRKILPRVRETVDTLRKQANSLTRRERLHIDALGAWADLDILEACRTWEELLTIAPHDILAMKLHHTMAFYTGRSQVLRSVIEGALHAWDETVPGYSSVQGMYAYALEECGAYDEAEKWGRDAVASNPNDLWAIHAVGHVLDMQRRYKEGVDWLKKPHFGETPPYLLKIKQEIADEYEYIKSMQQQQMAAGVGTDAGRWSATDRESLLPLHAPCRRVRRRHQ